MSQNSLLLLAVRLLVVVPLAAPSRWRYRFVLSSTHVGQLALALQRAPERGGERGGNEEDERRGG